MTKSILLSLCLTFGYLSGSFAQSSNEQEAFQVFKEAREAYQHQNFNSAAQLLTQTKTLLGSSNIRIQPMLIKSLYEIQDWRKAKTEINVYYNLNPDKELVEYQEIAKLEKEVSAKINEEENLFQSARQQRSVSQYQSYLNQFPYGKYRNEVSELLRTQNDENAWNAAQSKNSTASYYAYLESYPNGNYSVLAKATIERWDNEAYEKAVNDGTQEALNYYLSNYPKGQYRNVISNTLKDRIEYDTYLQAKTTNIITDYESYIKKYPNGKYSAEVNQIIENSYFSYGKEAYKNKNYSSAKDYYNTYLSKYPNGYYNEEVNQQLKKTGRKLKQSNAGFFMYNYDTQSPIGISFGNLKARKVVGCYFTVKMNSNIFTGFKSTYKIDNTGDNDSPWRTEVTDEIKKANVSGSFGLTFRVVYPLYLYAGAGIGYYPEYVKVNTFSSSNNTPGDPEWMKNTDESKVGFFPEGGLMLKVVNAVVLKYGVSYYQKIHHQIGFGVQF